MGEISKKEFRGYVEAKSKILMFKVQLILEQHGVRGVHPPRSRKSPRLTYHQWPSLLEVPLYPWIQPTLDCVVR